MPTGSLGLGEKRGSRSGPGQPANAVIQDDTVEDAAVERLRHGTQLSYTIARWLVRRGLVDPSEAQSFLEPKLKSLTPPDAMVGREATAKRIAEAVKRQQPVVVFGDYDCDGITSAAVLTEVIRSVGGRAVPLLASRFDGGYGVSARAVERILEQTPGLLITCDCGSSDHESLRKVAAAGVDVVVIDHHLVPDAPLPAIAFLNPHRPECGFPYKGLASCGLALSVAAALRKELGVKLDIRQWLDLVAIGTIADVAPLDLDNRALVRAGLSRLACTSRPGLRALFDLIKLDLRSPVSGRDVSFRVAPQLNAPGRLGAPDVALQLLLEKDEVKAGDLALRVFEISQQRRALQEQMVEQATLQVEAGTYAKDTALVVGSADWNPGIAGIVAGRLVERYNKPVVVLGFEAMVAKGSVRGPAGARLHDSLSMCQELLTRFGGHQAAAGVELRVADLERFRERFCLAVKQCPTQEQFSTEELLTLDPRDEPQRVLADLDRLEPCGEKNPRPQLQVRGKVRVAREVKGGHLKLELETERGGCLGGFAVNQGNVSQTIPDEVTVVGDLRHNNYPGSPPVEMFVEQIVMPNPL